MYLEMSTLWKNYLWTNESEEKEMKKLMEFCKIYDIEIFMHYNYGLGGYTWQATKNRENFSISYSDEEIQNFDNLDLILDDFMSRVIEQFKLNTIEAILERAKVKWSDNPLTAVRTVVSCNKLAPLTLEEQERITNMWKAQFYSD